MLGRVAGGRGESGWHTLMVSGGQSFRHVRHLTLARWAEPGDGQAGLGLLDDRQAWA